MLNVCLWFRIDEERQKCSFRLFDLRVAQITHHITKKDVNDTISSES